MSERFIKIPIDIIVTSSLSRAIDTGKIIAERIQKPIVDSLSMFTEYEFPSETLGLHYDDERHVEAVRATKERFLTNKALYPEEETFSELQQRVNKVLEYIKNRSEENILIVSHNTFIKFLFASLCVKDSLTPLIFNNFNRTLRSSNTGITRVELRGDGKWVIWQWNDSAHLG